MKKHLRFIGAILMMVLFSYAAQAQVSYYTFSETTGNSFSSISATGASVSLADDADDQVNIGFTFTYNSIDYTQVNIGSNGYLAFGSNSATSYSNDIASTTSGKMDVFAPFWDDLSPQNGGNVYYKTQGTSPNQIFIVEYNNIQHYSGSSSSTVTCQAVLYEGSNNIEFRYGASTMTGASGSIGINESPGGSSHFISVTPGSPATSSTTSGANSISAPPSNGVNYLFTYAVPACVAPTAQAVTNITVSGADLGWTDASGSYWDIYVTTAGGAAPTQGATPTANDLAATGNPYTYSAGSAATSYDWYVRSDCDQDNVGTSSWLGPNTFTTNCATVTTFPYTQDFENAGAIPNCWSQDIANNEDWKFSTSAAYAASSDHTSGSGYQAWIDDSSPHDANPSGLVSPLFNTTSLTSPLLEFYYWIGRGGSSVSTLSVDVYDGTSWNISVATFAINNGWIKGSVNLTTYTSTSLQIRFSVIEDASGYDCDVSIDDVVIKEAPACPDPTAQAETNIGINVADLAWTENGSATQWNIKYGVTGFDPSTSGTTVAVTTNPYTLLGLSASTTYDWYVQADCGGGSSSTWVGPHAFTTTDGKAVNPNPADGASGVLVSATTLDWDDVAGADGYHISVGTTSGGTDVVNNAAISGATNSTYTVTANWNYSTIYYWTITTDYNLGSSSVAGDEWTFTTECGTYSSFPYSQDFSSWSPTCWDVDPASTGSTDDWISYNSSSARANFYSQTSGKTDIMVTPTFDVSSLTTPIFDFDWSHKLYASGNEDSLSVEISDDGGTSWHQVWTKGGSNLESNDGAGNTAPGSFVNSGDIDISAYGNTIQIRFYGTSDYGDDLFIDNFRIRETPTCPDPTAQTETNILLNSADLAWTENGGATQWTIKYGATGFDPSTSGTTAAVNTNPSYTLGGLTAGTVYDWYVQADCGSGSTSSWTGPHTFTTSDGKAVNPVPADGASGIAVSAKTLDWDDVANADGYHISVGTTTGGTDIVNDAAITGATNSTYTVSSDWSINTTYYWTVTTDYNSGSQITGDEWTFTSQVGPHSFPLTEDFESGFTYFDNESGNGANFADETTLYHSGSHSVKNAYGNSETNILVETGILDLSSTSSALLEFWHIAKTEGNYDECYIEISTDGGNTYNQLPPTTYSGLGTYDQGSGKYCFWEDSYSTWGTTSSTPDNTWWKKEKFDLSGYNVANVRFRFRLDADVSTTRDGWYIDDIHIYEPACPDPTAQTETNITVSGADLGWTDASGSHWDLYIVPAGDPAPTQTTSPTENDITSNPFTYSSGTINTSYDWYVRSDCDQDNSGTSAWVGSSTFTTADGKATNPNPADNALDIAISAKTLDWDDVAGATGYHITIGTTMGANDIVDNVATTGGASEYTVASNWGFDDDYYWTVTTDFSGSSAVGDEWSFMTVDGKATNPTPVDGASDILVSATTLDWDDVADADGYHISVGTTSGGTEVVNNVAISGSTNSTYTVTANWNYSTTYYWTITTDYNSGSTIVGDEWTFTTECGTYTPDYSQDFATYVPNCWSEAQGLLTSNTSFSSTTTSTWGAKNFANGSSNNSAYINIYGTSKKEWVISPSIDLSGGSYQLEFDIALTDYGNSGAPDNANPPTDNGMGSDDTLAVIISTDDGVTWSKSNLLQTFTSSTSISTTGDHIIIDLSSYNTTVKIAFYGKSDVSNEDNDLFIDNFEVRTPPTCPQPTAQTVTVITTSGADLGWTDGSGSHWDIYVVPTGDPAPVQGSTPTADDVTSNPYTYSGGLGNTTYDWYVRSDCNQDNSGTSTWTGPNSFTTSAILSSVVNGLTSKCSPQFVRPNEGNPPTAQSTNTVFYDKFTFTVPVTGTYDVVASWTGFDGYLHVYENTFDPANPMTDVIGGNDDEGGTAGSKVPGLSLTSGTNYIVVGSGYSANNYGESSFHVEGASAATMPSATDHNGVPYRTTYTIPSTDGTSRASDYECDDDNGWTTYYDDAGTATDYTDDYLLLAVKKNGNDIGAATVTLDGAAGAAEITPSTTFSKYVNSFDGWYVFNRYWVLSPATQPTSDVDVRFYYKDADFNDLKTAIGNAGKTVPTAVTELSVVKINDLNSSNYDPDPANGHNNIPKASAYNTDGAWIYNPPSSSSTVTNAKWADGNYNGADHYFEFTVSHFSGGGGGAAGNANDGSLPIELLSFNAFANGDINQVVWKTATEFNVEKFIVERMDPATQKIEEIGTVKAVGNSNTIQSYAFDDKQPLKEAYYRIRNVDYDGATESFDWVYVKRGATEFKLVNLYPNPAHNSTTIELVNPIDHSIHLEIRDVVGKIILTKDYESADGLQKLDIDLSAFSAGTYYLSIDNSKERLVKMLIVR